MPEPQASSGGRSSPSSLSVPRAPRLRTYLLALVLAVLLPALAISAAAAWHLLGSYRASFETRLRDTSRAMALFVDSELATSRAAVTSLASSPLLERDDFPAFDKWARSVAGTVGGWVIVNEAALGHRQLVNTILPEGAPLPSPSNPGEGAWDIIRRVVETGEPAVSDLFLGRATGRTVVVIAAPSFQNGQVTRVVILGVDPARLSERLRERRPSGSAFVSVADSQSRIVARSQDHDRYVGTVPPSRGVPEEERGRGLFRAETVYGQPGMFAAERLKMAPGWTVVVSEPLSQYDASWRAPLAALAGGSVVALAVGLAIAAWLARRILRPVHALRARAQALAAGGELMFLTVVPAANVAEFETMRVAIEDAEVVLAAREAEFRAIFETASAGVAETDTRTVRYIRVNHCFCEIVGRTEEELVGRLGPDDIAHPEDRTEIAVGSTSRHSGPGRTRGVSRVLRPDGTVIWVQYSEAPSHRDEEGHPLRVVTVVQDITDRKRAEETLALLAREVDHRAKNALAVIQTALRLSPREDLGTYAAAVEGRVGALARAQTLLANENWSGVSLRELVQGELAPFTSGQSVNLSGPHIVLPADMAQPLGMTIHELATNALKHGALSVAEGSVSISWRPADGASDHLHLSWVEAGGPPVTHPPERRGFGSRVIEGTLRRQLSGEVSFSWKTSGLVCEMTVPLRTGLSIGGSADDLAVS